MPHSKSAKKRLRQNQARHVFNRSRKREIATRTKTLMAAIEAGELDRARELLGVVTSKIDRARKKNVLHANKAARMKSRLARVFNTAARGTAASETAGGD